MRKFTTILLFAWALIYGPFATVLCAQWAGVIGASRSTSSPSYLVSEDFETDYSGPPPSWVNGSGTLNYYSATSPAPIVGAHSAQQSSGSQLGYIDFTGQSDVWAFCAFNPDVNVAAYALYLTSGGVPGAGDEVYVRGWFGSWALFGGGQSQFGGTSTISQTYYVWIHYTKGTGANCVCDAYTSTTTTRPGSPSLTISNGNQTNNMSRLYLSGSGTALDKITWDYIRVSTTSIGSAPP